MTGPVLRTTAGTSLRICTYLSSKVRCTAHAVPGSQLCREHRELSLARTYAWIAGRKARTGLTVSIPRDMQ